MNYPLFKYTDITRVIACQGDHPKNFYFSDKEATWELSGHVPTPPALTPLTVEINS